MSKQMPDMILSGICGHEFFKKYATENLIKASDIDSVSFGTYSLCGAPFVFHPEKLNLWRIGAHR